MILKMHVHPHVLLQTHTHSHPHVLRSLSGLDLHVVSVALRSDPDRLVGKGF